MRVLSVSFITGLAAITGSLGAATASELIYTPINPSFGGNPQNGAWLFQQATSQGQGAQGGGGPGFSIDFPDFGDIPQPDPDPVDLPDVPGEPT